MAATPDPHLPPENAAPPPPPRRFGMARDALRIAFLRRVSTERLHATPLSICIAAILAIAVPTLYGVVEYGLGGMWSVAAVPGSVFVVFMSLVAAAAIGGTAHRDDAIAPIWLAALLAWIVIDTLTLAIWFALGHSMGPGVSQILSSAFFYVPLMWLAVAVARFCGSLTPGHSPRGIVALFLAVVLLAAPMALVNPDRSLWVRDWRKDADASGDDWKVRQAAAKEEAFYRQPDILAAELAAVEPGRKGVVDVFFVGMAGYGQQDVFMREVDKVAQLMRSRFDATGRVVKLVNNPKTVYSSPIATVTSLKATLKRVAAQMDLEEDVLVLFLTSHGSSDHKFSVTLFPLQLNEVTPETLRGALDESGIRNRVVIVSACYSGGFIEKLKDERTLAIASSAPDRNSFGCSNEAEWTYFGQAYFDEALRQTRSFTKAFEQAVVAVEAREKQGGHDPSRPVIAEGASIGAKLAQLEAQLATPPGTVTTAAPVAPEAGDIYERYMEATRMAELIADSTAACRANKRLTSPDAWLDKDRNTFGGLDRSSPLWPRLVQAWERHSEDFCVKANDPQLFKRIYSQHLRAVMSPESLTPALHFIATSAGRAWLQKDQEATRLTWAELGKIQARLSEGSYAKYVEEQNAIVMTYRNGAAKR